VKEEAGGEGRGRKGEEKRRESATVSISEPRRITRFSFVALLSVIRGSDSK